MYQPRWLAPTANIRLSAAAAVLLASMALAHSNAQPARGTAIEGAIVRGRVLDTVGPVTGAEISLTRRQEADQAGPAMRVTKSDTAGTFAFTAVRPGIYRLECRRLGYARSAVYFILRDTPDTSGDARAWGDSSPEPKSRRWNRRRWQHC
jgi:carboxypeptidase family protein